MPEKSAIQVLAVDDNSSDLLALREILGNLQIDLVAASSGDQALQLLLDRDFALVLLDARMPGLSGIETASMIRRRERSRTTPIIFLTAYDQDDREIVRAYSLGAVDVLSKPLVPEILKAKVSVFVELYRKTQQVHEQGQLLREALERAHRASLAEAQRSWGAERERVLATERERLEITLRSIGDAVLTVDAGGRITLMNPAACAFTGWPFEAARGRPIGDVMEVVDPETRAPRRRWLEEVSAQIEIPQLDALLLARDGSERRVTASVAPIESPGGLAAGGAVFVLRDVTAQRKMERELEERQRLEALGVLAGGIAHDLNNVLALILGNSSLARVRLGEHHAALPLLLEVETACERATGLAAQLLTFARGGTPVRKSMQVQDLIPDAVELALCGSSSSVEYDIAPDLWPAEVDQAQIHEVLSSLIVNASESMDGAGRIRVSVDNLRVMPQDGLLLKPGRYVQIAIHDDGPGIPPEHLTRVFEPYFSTRAPGRGLGLAGAYSIVNRHGGLISVESPPGRGTTFLVRLPAGESEAEVVDARASERVSLSGSGCVLVMDDEQRLLDMIVDCLREMGYQVAGASDGQAAIDIYRTELAAGRRFDAVLLDLTVRGGMGGVEALKELRALDPDVRAIASSGYSNDQVLSSYQEYGFVAVLPKPYRFAMLARALRVAMSDRPFFRRAEGGQQ